MNEELLKSLRVVIKEELKSVKKDLTEIKLGQRQLSKDIAAILG